MCNAGSLKHVAVRQIHLVCLYFLLGVRYAHNTRLLSVCMISMSCMYENCNLPPFNSGEAENWSYYNNQALEPPFDSSDLFEDIMELPAAVLHPKVASDIVHGIEFAQKHDIGISVKVLGHSYFGASTNRGTLLIKMSSHYPQYGIEDL